MGRKRSKTDVQQIYGGKGKTKSRKKTTKKLKILEWIGMKWPVHSFEGEHVNLITEHDGKSSPAMET